MLENGAWGEKICKGEASAKCYAENVKVSQAVRKLSRVTKIFKEVELLKN